MAGPRRVPSSTTLTTLTRLPCGNVRTSPARTWWFGLSVGSLLTRTRPDLHKVDAKVRLLQNLANHNHLSRRSVTEPPSPASTRNLKIPQSGKR